MNKIRRAALQEIIDTLTKLRSALDNGDALSDLRGELDSVQADEQESFDNMPEGIQASEQGQASESAAEAIESASGSLDDAMSSLSEVLDSIDSALASIEEAQA